MDKTYLNFLEEYLDKTDLILTQEEKELRDILSNIYIEENELNILSNYDNKNVIKLYAFKKYINVLLYSYHFETSSNINKKILINKNYIIENTDYNYLTSKSLKVQNLPLIILTTRNLSYSLIFNTKQELARSNRLIEDSITKLGNVQIKTNINKIETENFEIFLLGNKSYFYKTKNTFVINMEDLNDNVTNLVLAYCIKKYNLQFNRFEFDNILNSTIQQIKNRATKLPDEAEQKLKDLSKELVMNRFKDKFRETLRNSLDSLISESEEKFDEYKELCERIDNLKLKIAFIKDTLDKEIKELDDYIKINNKIFKYDIDITGKSTLLLTLYYKFMPIVFLDKDLLQNALRENLYSHYTEQLNSLLEHDNLKLLVAPTKIKIEININSHDYSTATTTLIDSVGNGHVLYNGNGCLGTFKAPLYEAVRTLDLKRIVGLLTQWNQSISPIDYAGRRTLERPVIYDENTQKIVFDITNKYTNLDLNRVKYKESGEVTICD